MTKMTVRARVGRTLWRGNNFLKQLRRKADIFTLLSSNFGSPVVVINDTSLKTIG